MIKRTLILFAGLLVGIWATAQTKSYSLNDVIQMARSESPAWLSAETRKENNYWRYKTYKSNYNPQLILSGMLPSFNKRVTPVTQPDGSIAYREVNNNTVNMQLGLSQVIAPTGGTVSVYSNLNRFDDFQFGDSTVTQYSGEPISIGLNQPIFQFNQLKWDKRIAPLEYEESQKKYFEELEQISVNATWRFFNLLLAQTSLEIAQKNVESNDTIFKIAQGRYNLGKITENDLLKLELNLVNSKLAVTKALVEQESASLQLKSFIGLSDTDPVILVIPKEIPDFIVDENVALVEARKNKSDMVTFKRQQLEAEEGVTRAKKSSGVNMNLQAVYGLNDLGSDIAQVYQEPGENIRVGLQLNVPVLDWGRQKARIMTAEANKKLVEYQILQDEETFDQDILTQARNFNMLKEQVKSRVISDQIAQRAYDISKQLFLIGKISITDLNQSIEAKDLAKQNYISSLRDYWAAYYQLREKTLYDFHHDQLLLRDIQTD
ncbi:MAG: TolC family protein [Bacteroidota bacterium]